VNGRKYSFLDACRRSRGQEGLLEGAELVVDAAVEGGKGEIGSSEFEEEGEDEGLVQVNDYLEFLVSRSIGT
jgi:hypothetical protein